MIPGRRLARSIVATFALCRKAAHQAAVEVLFALCYAIKFLIKKGLQAIDYLVMPLEGLW